MGSDLLPVPHILIVSAFQSLFASPRLHRPPVTSIIISRPNEGQIPRLACPRITRGFVEYVWIWAIVIVIITTIPYWPINAVDRSGTEERLKGRMTTCLIEMKDSQRDLNAAMNTGPFARIDACP